MKIKAGTFFHYLFVLVNLVTVVSISIWLYSLSGTKGLLIWDPFYRNIFIIIFSTAFAGIIFLLLEKFLFKRIFPRKKRVFSIITVVVSIIFTLPSIALTYYTQKDLTPPNQNISPILLFSPNDEYKAYDAMSVIEWTESDTVGEITISDGGKTRKISDEKAVQKHVYELGSLEPGKSYEIIFNNGEKSNFKIPLNANKFSFTSDAHFGREESRNEYTYQLFEEICKPENGYDAFFYLGDIVETGFTGKEWIEALKNFKMRKNTVPSFFLAGNHDLLFGGEYNYEKYLTPSKNTGKDTGRIGRFDLGSTHFIYLPLYWGMEEFTAKDMDWLISQLKSIPREDFTVVLSHCIFYSSGVVLNGMNWADHFETTVKLSPEFEKYGVDLVISGHDHHMEYLEKNGVSYAVIGTAGGLPDPERTIISPYSVWYADDVFGFLDLTVSEDNFVLSFKNPKGITIYDKTVRMSK